MTGGMPGFMLIYDFYSYLDTTDVDLFVRGRSSWGMPKGQSTGELGQRSGEFRLRCHYQRLELLRN